ncbi:MAG: hypothetical protein LBD21_06290 [Tannerellaceae bacterium]|jgi:hypothetical protein|nr:hypothetical protein [Tannerellaceae bacterium]
MNDIINNESVNAKIRIKSSATEQFKRHADNHCLYNQSCADFINPKTPLGEFNLLVI